MDHSKLWNQPDRFVCKLPGMISTITSVACEGYRIYIEKEFGRDGENYKMLECCRKCLWERSNDN